jgi:hypothetical protein
VFPRQRKAKQSKIAKQGIAKQSNAAQQRNATQSKSMQQQAMPQWCLATRAREFPFICCVLVAVQLARRFEQCAPPCDLSGDPRAAKQKSQQAQLNTQQQALLQAVWNHLHQRLSPSRH